MARFEEIQMRIAESAKNYLELYSMQVFVEQFTLDRECRFFVTLSDLESPFPVSASVSFSFDAFQTGMTLLDDEVEKDSDVDSSIDLEFTVNLPIMRGSPDVQALLAEVHEDFPDAEALLIFKEIFSGAEPLREYEISYSYSVEAEDIMDAELMDELFEELRGMLDLVYRRTFPHIDTSWYRDQDDSFKEN
jgi:hypothetical protein